MLIILKKGNVIYLTLYLNYSGRLHMLMWDIHKCIYIFALLLFLLTKASMNDKDNTGC